jgi:ankyrin repeat protein
VRAAVLALGAFACGAPPPCELCDAVAAGDTAAVGAALRAGAAVTPQAWQTALERLDRGGGRDPVDAKDREIVDVLLRHGADPNHVWVTTSGVRRDLRSRTERFAAATLLAAWDDPSLVDALIERGLDATGTAGGEALVAAAGAEHGRAVARLLEAGAPVNHVSAHDGLTALASAIQTRNLAVIAALESAGAVEWVSRD